MPPSLPFQVDGLLMNIIWLIDNHDNHDYNNQAPHSPPSDDLEPPAGLSFSALGQAPGEGLGYQVMIAMILVKHLGIIIMIAMILVKHLGIIIMIAMI